MTTFVLPCGTSVLDNLKAGRGCREIGNEQVGKLQDWASGLRIHDTSPTVWGREVTQTVETQLTKLRPILPTVSAEWSSLAQHIPELCADDRIVLLASDTFEGVLAALLNARLLGQRVRYLTFRPSDGRSEELTLSGDGTGGSVDIVRIEGLRPVDTSEFEAAMKHTGRTLRWATDTRIGPLVVILTGGYKATIPYLAVLAEYAKALAPVQAFCLHEGDRSDDRPPPIEIFLRTVDLDADGAEINAALAGDVPRHIGRLRDFAYRRNHLAKADELTPLGWAIKAFIDG